MADEHEACVPAGAFLASPEAAAGHSPDSIGRAYDMRLGSS